MGDTYFRMPISSQRENEFKRLKESLEKIGIDQPTYDEVTALLLEKNKRLVMNEKDIKEIIKRLRGIS